MTARPQTEAGRRLVAIMYAPPYVGMFRPALIREILAIEEEAGLRGVGVGQISRHWDHCDHGPEMAEWNVSEPVCVAEHHETNPQSAGVYASASVNDGIHWNGEHWHMECALDEAIRQIGVTPDETAR